MLKCFNSCNSRNSQCRIILVKITIGHDYLYAPVFVHKLIRNLIKSIKILELGHTSKYVRLNYLIKFSQKVFKNRLF